MENSNNYNEYNEILFWRVFHNVVLVRLIFKQIHELEFIDYGSDGYYQIHIDNKIKFKDINSLDWLIYNGQLELLKCKLKACDEHLDLGELTLNELFYELSYTCKSNINDKKESNQLFKDIIILALNNNYLLSTIFKNKINIILKLLLQYNHFEIFEIITTTTTTPPVHPSLILEWSLRYSTPVIVDSIINLYKQHQQDINPIFQYSNVKKRSLKLASWNSYEMVNYVLNGFKLNSDNNNNISNSPTDNIIKLVLNNLKLFNNKLKSIIEENDEEDDGYQFSNEEEIEIQDKLLLFKVNFDNDKNDENGNETNFSVVENEKLCIKMIELKCFTSFNLKIKEILDSNKGLTGHDKLKMIKKIKEKTTSLLDNNTQSEPQYKGLRQVITSINGEYCPTPKYEIAIRNYLSSIIINSLSIMVKDTSHDGDPILKNSNLSDRIWDQEISFNKPYCFNLKRTINDCIQLQKINNCNSKRVIDNIKILISNFNYSITNSPDKISNGYIRIYNKILNYKFKRLLQCQDITIDKINYVLDLINNEIKTISTDKITTEISIKQLVFHTFYYLSIKSNKFTKFLLELPFIKIKKSYSPNFGEDENQIKYDDNSMFELHHINSSFVEFNLNPNIFTFEYLFGNGGNGSNGGASFDQVLDELINQLIYLPIKNIYKPQNHYNNTLNYVLSYCLDIKRSDLFFKHLDIIQQQLNDKSINYGDFPNLIDKINNPVASTTESTTSSLLSTICKEYGFNEIEDFKQLNDGDRVFYYSDIVFGKACKLLSSNQHHQQHEFNRFISFCSFHSISNCILNPNFIKLIKYYNSFKCVDINKLLNITYLLNNSKLINYLISNHYQNYYHYSTYSVMNTPIPMNINNYWNHIFSLLKQLVLKDLDCHEFFFNNIISKFYSDNNGNNDTKSDDKIIIDILKNFINKKK